MRAASNTAQKKKSVAWLKSEFVAKLKSSTTSSSTDQDAKQSMKTKYAPPTERYYLIMIVTSKMMDIKHVRISKKGN